MIQDERVRRLNGAEMVRGRYVVYWMQASQRAEHNHALEFAVRTANERGLPVVCYFGLTADFPQANLRHYTFMLEGLDDVRQTLAARGIRLVLRVGPPFEGLIDLASRAAAVVVDRGYLRVQRKWRRRAAAEIPCVLIEVETDAVVPVEVASEKEEYAAATLRPKIRRQMDRFLVPLKHGKVKHDSLGLRLAGENWTSPSTLLKKLEVDPSVAPVAAFRGGASAARERLSSFVRENLRDYTDLRNEPGLEVSSRLSPYLHFGQISPLHVALTVGKARGKPRACKEDFLEELIVRRELGLNFVRFNPAYDSFRALPAWAAQSLARHARDKREPTYSLKNLEAARTHDPYWNAAMTEMLVTGYMHNYMRMYWGKKILEWSPTPEKALKTALYLNNKYFLDGRDPNSFAGVAWCFGKHDRPWTERPIFGKIRYMNARGLERKFDMDAYVRRVRAMERGDARSSGRSGREPD